MAKDIQGPCSEKKKKKRKTKGNEVCSNTFSFHFRQSIQSLPALKTLDLRHAGTLSTTRAVEWGARSASAFAAPTAPPLSAVGFGPRRMSAESFHPDDQCQSSSFWTCPSGLGNLGRPSPNSHCSVGSKSAESTPFCPTFGRKKRGNEPRFPFDGI